MPDLIDGYVEQVRGSRRAAAPAVERIRSGEAWSGGGRLLRPVIQAGQAGGEVGRSRAARRWWSLRRHVGVMAHRLRVLFDELAPVESLAQRLEATFP
ncbi:hypothetical protein D3C87_1655060 [compost metagenome]